MKKFIELKLKILAKWVLKKYKPMVIGITGSVGKTSCKEAVYTVLSIAGKNVERSTKNYNNEIGLPLSILRMASPGKNVFGWFKVFWGSVKLLLETDVNYPEIIILEMGIDRPGDMDYLNSIVTPSIGIVTTIGSVHLEYFKNKNELQKEKGKLIKNVDKDGWSIINYDDEETKKMTELSRAKILTYGFDKDAMVRASDVIFSYQGDKKHGQIRGISFKLSYQGSSIPVHIPKALGMGVVYSALSAASVGIAMGLNLHEISQSLQNFRPPKGRLNIIPGIKKTTVIDDSYNAEPKSMALAINIMKDMEAKSGQRKILVLGDMLELGSQSEKSHREVGRLAAQSGVQKLVTVGERAKDIAKGAKENGMGEGDIYSLADSVTAGRFIQDLIKSGDLVLVKGSQGMRMEKIVLEIMADPLQASNLLVRQDESWIRK